MADLRKELKAYSVAELLRRRRRIAFRSGILVALATALAVVSLYRDDKVNTPGLLIAVATFVVTLSTLSQVKAINAELRSRKR